MERFVTLIFLFLQVLQATSTWARLGGNLVVVECVDTEELGAKTAGSRRRNPWLNEADPGFDMENQIIVRDPPELN